MSCLLPVCTNGPRARRVGGKRGLWVWCASLAFTAAASASDTLDWQSVRSEHGVEVLQAQIVGSDFKVTRGTLVSRARLFDALAVLRDVDACSTWLHRCKSGRVVKQQSVGQAINYTVIDSPLMLKDRDTYVQSTTTYDADTQTLRVDMRGAEDAGPPEKRRVRVLDFNGYWLLQTLDDGRTRMTYEVHMNPQVSTKGAANATLATSVFETLRNVDRLAQAAPYLDTAVSVDELRQITRPSTAPPE